MNPELSRRMARAMTINGIDFETRFKFATEVMAANSFYELSKEAQEFITLAELTKKSATLKFSFDQPRDENGRWTDTGSVTLPGEHENVLAFVKAAKELSDFTEEHADGFTQEQYAEYDRLSKVVNDIRRSDPVTAKRGDFLMLAERAYSETADNLEIPTQELKDIAQQNLQEYVNENPVAVQVPMSRIDAILDDGFKSMYETGTRGGKRGEEYRDYREQTEQFFFDHSERTTPETRPIYGFVPRPEGVRYYEADQAPHLDREMFDSVGNYGNTRIILKDSVKDRSTITMDDSLDTHITGYPVIPSPAREIDWTSVNAFRAMQQVEAGKDAPLASIPFTYVEAQIHGGVEASDIQQIDFPKQPTRAMVAKLDNLGIDYTVKAAL